MIKFSVLVAAVVDKGSDTGDASANCADPKIV
jgi:hypothetical protein